MKMKKKPTNPRGGKVVTVYTDGSISPNHGGAAAIVMSEIGMVVQMANRVLPLMTSTEAEYAGLILGLELAQAAGALVVELRMDSEVVVNQMAGHYAVNSARLKKLHWEACDLARQFAKVGYTHIPREQNGVADALASEASSGITWRLA
ncbi:MAG: ribonuclease HI family protein [Anaerolineaceae bacterium]|nr:ribonuclease HI family protein [Anaerolineaceae bacterium]